MNLARALIRGVAAALVVALLAIPRASAHETRPAYLELKETVAGQYHVIWRTPVLSGMRLPVSLQLPDDARNVQEPVVQELTDSLLERRWIDAGPRGLAGARIEFPGLQFTITDVLVRIDRLDGARSTEIIRPSRPYLDIVPPRGALAAAGVFVAQGVEHILLGVDHLLFVLGLLLIVRSKRMLVTTITAFTLAHSITLAAATLGWVDVPTGPLEAAIALSILFLGPEILRAARGETSFTIGRPWLVAFAFGLLHGFGFASGLATVGLPGAEIPIALVTFNLGVELGQLGVVALALLLARAAAPLASRWPRPAILLPAYAVGSLGAFWTIQRVVLMLENA